VVTEKPKNEKPNVKVKVKEKVKENIKDKYGTIGNVLLTGDEYQKLVEKYGASKTGRAIEYLDSYISEKGYKTKSHYLTITRWVMDAVSKPQTKPNQFTQFSGKQDYDMRELERMLEA
jgi:hypothetical protein